MGKLVPSRPCTDRQRRRRSARLLVAALLGVAFVGFKYCCLASFVFASPPATRRHWPSQRACSRRRECLPSAMRASRLAEDVAATDVENYEFEADVGKVMDIIVNSLYSNKDVFLRELVSNSADACDKKRFLALTEGETPPEAMKLRIKADKDARTLTIEDNGVGMQKAELIENLGRIARSGTANFVQRLEAGASDVNLIGQFGVGFYSAFLVADKIEVISRSFKEVPAAQRTWKWTSSSGSFTIEEAPEEEFFGETSGTKLVLHIKEGAQEYLESSKLSELLGRYSEFITFPIELWNERTEYDRVFDEEAPPPEEGAEPTMKSVPRIVLEWEVMNKVKPIWLRSSDSVNESEYSEFYKATFKAFDEPLAMTHFKVEGQIEFRALAFIPSMLPFELTRDMFADGGRAMRLYVKRVFINDKFSDLVPRWLIFLRGVVDSEDLPLNVGREIIQKSRTLKIMQKQLVRKVLDTINDLRDKDADKYEQFWKIYGKYFKVGLVEDADYKNELKAFVRFWSSTSADNQTSLPEYVSRMKEGQENIYFITGEGKKSVEIAPAMEMMRRKGFEVLYMVDPLDEICAQSMVEFEGKTLVDINKAGLKLDSTEDERKKLEETTKEYEGLATWLNEQLGDRVEKVQVSSRLVDSPATLVQGDWGMSPMMQRYMKSQASSNSENVFDFGPRNQAILEINPEHAAIQKLKMAMEAAPDADDTKDMVMMIFETAALIGGYPIEDPSEFARRITKLMNADSTE